MSCLSADPFVKLGVSRFSSPGMFYPHAQLDPGTTVGGYSGGADPGTLTANPNKPGLPRKEQNRIGQEWLLNASFEKFELDVRQQLTRMLAGPDFDPAEDILTITVNRWPYAYAYTYDSLADPEMPLEERPHIVGRNRFGLVSTANSDAGAAAFTNQAMDEANRAVEDRWFARGSPKKLTRPFQICERKRSGLYPVVPSLQSAAEAFYDSDLGLQDRTLATLNMKWCMPDELKFRLRQSSLRITRHLRPSEDARGRQNPLC